MRRYLLILYLIPLPLILVLPQAFGGDIPVLIEEVFSREYSIQVDGVGPPDTKQVFSREATIFVNNGPTEDYTQMISRELSIVVTSDEPPAPVGHIDITLSPTGDTATLDWSTYNQWAELDIDHFVVYFSTDSPFDTVPADGLQTVIQLAGSTSATIEGLPEFSDHYFAVVAVDALGNFDPSVTYTGGYVISPEVVSREVSLFVENGTHSDAVSREISFVVVSDAPPEPVPDIMVSASDAGDRVTLDWSAYNQWAELDINHFDIYYTDTGHFDTVPGDGLEKIQVRAGESSVTLDGLTSFSDHYFAVVPVDASGHYDPGVVSSAAYNFPQTISREISVFVGQESPPTHKQVISREVSILTPDSAVPAPVTCSDCGFTAETSLTEYCAVDLDWTSYNEPAQGDVVRYDIYMATEQEEYFDNIDGMTPVESVANGTQYYTLGGLPDSGIFYFAVVAVDALGNVNPVVHSTLAQASQCHMEDIAGLHVNTVEERLVFTWEAPTVGSEFLDHYQVYVNGSRTPVNLDPETTSWEVGDLMDPNGYSIMITAVDIFGNETRGLAATGFMVYPGFNLISYAVSLTEEGLTAREWLEAMGNESEIASIERYNPSTEHMESVSFENTWDFDIEEGQAYVIRMNISKAFSLKGPSPDSTLFLDHGLNLVGYPGPSQGVSCFGWLQALGIDDVSSIQRFNTERGEFESCGWCLDSESVDRPCGIDFNISSTEGYLIHMTNDFVFNNHQ